MKNSKTKNVIILKRINNTLKVDSRLSVSKKVYPNVMGHMSGGSAYVLLKRDNLVVDNLKDYLIRGVLEKGYEIDKELIINAFFAKYTEIWINRDNVGITIGYGINGESSFSFSVDLIDHDRMDVLIKHNSYQDTGGDVCNVDIDNFLRSSFNGRRQYGYNNDSVKMCNPIPSETPSGQRNPINLAKNLSSHDYNNCITRKRPILTDAEFQKHTGVSSPALKENRPTPMAAQSDLSRLLDKINCVGRNVSTNNNNNNNMRKHTGAPRIDDRPLRVNKDTLFSGAMVHMGYDATSGAITHVGVYHPKEQLWYIENVDEKIISDKHVKKFIDITQDLHLIETGMKNDNGFVFSHVFIQHIVKQHPELVSIQFRKIS